MNYIQNGSFEENLRLPLVTLGKTPPCVLTIAGSDSGGGAGIQAELRTFALLGIHALVSITAVTVQNSMGVSQVNTMPEQFVYDQMDSVYTDIGFKVAKTGMLANSKIILKVAEFFNEHKIGSGNEIPFVLDPVCVSMHGHPLLDEDSYPIMISELIPLATIVTPNLDEVKFLTDITVTDKNSAIAAGHRFLDWGAKSALIKGGHATGEHAIDYLVLEDKYVELTRSRRIWDGINHDHGGGDTLASAIASALAVDYPLIDAVEFSKEWVDRSVKAAYPLGKGHGPVNASWILYQ